MKEFMSKLASTSHALRNLQDRQSDKNELIEELQTRLVNFENHLRGHKQELEYCRLSLSVFTKKARETETSVFHLTYTISMLRNEIRKLQSRVINLQEESGVRELRLKQERNMNYELTRDAKSNCHSRQPHYLYHRIDNFSAIKKPLPVASAEGLRNKDGVEAFGVDELILRKKRKEATMSRRVPTS